MSIKDWLKKLFLWKKKPNKLYVIAIHRAILECEHNISPGVGNSSCPFQLKALGDLLTYESFYLTNKEFAKLIYAAERCNADLLHEKPGFIKNGFSNLRDILLSEKEKLNATR